MVDPCRVMSLSDEMMVERPARQRVMWFSQTDLCAGATYNRNGVSRIRGRSTPSNIAPVRLISLMTPGGADRYIRKGAKSYRSA